MEMDLHNGELYLADNAPIRLRRARGLRVVCTAGHVWLTVAGEPGDIHLQLGESYCITANGLALLEAIGNGRVRLEWSAPQWHSGLVPAWRRFFAELLPSPRRSAILYCLQVAFAPATAYTLFKTPTTRGDRK